MCVYTNCLYYSLLSELWPSLYVYLPYKTLNIKLDNDKHVSNPCYMCMCVCVHVCWCVGVYYLFAQALHNVYLCTLICSI